MSAPSTEREERDKLLGHDYDGIREYDNPLPGWWVWLFIATIVFSVGYWVYYHLGPGPTVIAEYEAEVQRTAPRAESTTAGDAMSESALKALLSDSAALASAKATYGARCAACHGPAGQGLIGPNLTDDYTLHGSRLADIARVIGEGVPDKGMVAWKGVLKPAEIAGLAAYVASLRGTNPPNPKPPQGAKAPAE